MRTGKEGWRVLNGGGEREGGREGKLREKGGMMREGRFGPIFFD